MKIRIPVVNQMVEKNVGQFVRPSVRPLVQNPCVYQSEKRPINEWTYWPTNRSVNKLINTSTNEQTNE